MTTKRTIISVVSFVRNMSFGRIMSELKCKNCGMEASYAGANIADSRKTCGSDGRPSEIEASDGSVKYAYGGNKHDWFERR